MKHKTMRQLLIIALMLACGQAFGQKLRFKVDGVKDTTVFLARYYGSKLFYADTTQVKNGVAEFTDKGLKPGVLAYVMPGQKYFEFIYNKEDVWLETTAKDLVGDMKVKKSEENKIFIPYIQYIQAQRTKASGLSAERDKLDKSSADHKAKGEQIDAISKEVVAYQQNIFKNHWNTLTSRVIKMSVDVETPKEAPANFRDAKGNIIDSNWRYHYYKAHFWDNIDLNDDRLVNTPVIFNKLDAYIGKTLTVQQPDSVLATVIPMVDKLNPNGEMFRYIVDHVTNNAAKSKIIGMDKVYVLMADRYYCRTNPATGKSYAYWMPEDKLKTLCEDDIKIQKHLVQGVVPPNIILRDTTDTKWRDFYSLKNEYTILYFWDPECGHCKKVTPKLVELYEKKLKSRNVDVFAIGKATGDDFEKWKKYIRDNKLSFINVALTQKLYEAAMQDASQFVPKYTTLESLNYHDTYDLYATPLVILLDKDKKIVSKRLSISQLEDLLDHLQNVKNPVKIIPADPENDEEGH
jgi:thiol-disulfide isomerase/thioredoxin